MSALTGALSFATASALLAQIEAAGESGHLDLSGVDRVDSAGVALLLAGLRAAHRHGVSFALHQPPRQLLTLLHFYGLDTMFERNDAR